MLQIKILAVTTVLLMSGFLLSSQAKAVEETVVLTEKQIEQISDSCRQSKSELERLHASDALIRVNIGQEYANLSSRLMAPLNSRIALNGLDGVELSQITVDYNRAVSQFQQRYLIYEASLSSAIRTDCKSDAVQYYSYIKNARRLRAEVAESVAEMDRLIVNYQQAFESFTTKALAGPK